MYNNIQLSIITPVYNTDPRYIEETIDSILNAQINSSFEIIIVNDGSSNENTINFLNNYKHQKVKIFHQENQGVAGARNFGISKAKGNLILPLDSDDILLPKKINKFIDFLIKNIEYDIVYGDIKQFGESSMSWKNGEYNRFKLLYLRNYVPNTSLYRKKVWEEIGGYSIKHKMSEDWDFWIRSSIVNKKFKYFSTYCYLYRRHETKISLSSIEAKNEKKYIKLTRDKYDNTIEVSYNTVNQYVLESFIEHKILIIKLLILVLFPKLFRLLQNKGIFKNNVIIS